MERHSHVSFFPPRLQVEVSYLNSASAYGLITRKAQGGWGCSGDSKQKSLVGKDRQSVDSGETLASALLNAQRSCLMKVFQNVAGDGSDRR